MSKPLPHSKPLDQFLKQFDGVAKPSDMKFKRMRNHPIDWLADPTPDGNFNIVYKDSYFEVVEGVALHIPIYKLDEFLTSIPERQYQEMEIRMNVPAVKKAWEHYQMLIKMCGDIDARY